VKQYENFGGVSHGLHAPLVSRVHKAGPMPPNDAVFASCNCGLAADVETMQGSADLQGYGSSQANTIYGNAGNNLINGAGGADTMLGGAGNDTYFVDNVGDGVVENPGEGSDAVFATVTYALSANVET
jgi:trimeric autotransporter adhesin